MKISIIIPALNEDKCLPRLLESIKNQSFKDYEIIVADANSTDNTPKIARKYGAKVVKGGLPGAGRNAGAKAAKGDFLFFMDADVKLPEDFLKKVYHEMQEKYLDLATCGSKPLSSLLIDKIMHDLANIYIKLHQFTEDPHAPGYCIFVSKRLFMRINGFDESVKLAEDHDFVKRASRFRPLKILKSTEIMVSVRRLIKEGRLNLIWKYLRVEMYRKFRGEIRKDTIDYEFSKFDKKRKRILNIKLRRLEQRLIRMNNEYKIFTRKYIIGNLTENYKQQLEKLKRRFDNINKSFKKIVLNNK
ncbi:glycosyl transferase family 2 [Candidatus Woesearchaeota archaeon]|nr:glycosyl transferase family 2 [Candidatus Woesearchaeota archaeon]|tara:strand:+ start:2398 stop:3303 length:906 start_codon:yes stop_codon:yes gene_type:complete